MRPVSVAEKTGPRKISFGGDFSLGIWSLIAFVAVYGGIF